jgi:thiol:disulfide interchange protein
LKTHAALIPFLLTAALAACDKPAGPAVPASTAVPAEIHWTEDYPAALAQAKAENKLLLLNFTGTDWCVPCQILEHTVFDSPGFRTWAGDKYILVTLDFPNRKQQDDALKARNKTLKEQYKVEGFPTILILDPAGKERARTLGFDEDKTAAAWFAEVDAQLEKSK